MNDKQYTQEMIKNLNARLKTKQEALTFDDTPTEGSVNPVTSEGVKAYADASKGTTYTAGENISISPNNVISAVDTTYTAGDNITIVNNVISSTTDVSGTNDGTNWTSLTINSDTKAIPQGCKIEDGFAFRFDKIEWSAPLSSPYAGDIWTDGKNTYSSNGPAQYVLDKSTSTWTPKTWTGLTSFDGSYVWTDGENIYYSLDSNQYVLDKATSTWIQKMWSGLTSFRGTDVWTDGDNIYYSNYSDHYILDKATSTWSAKTWTGLSYFYGEHMWTDGTNIYYSYVNGSYNNQYILNKETSTWSIITWNSTTSIAGYHGILGEDIWTDGENIYCFHSEHMSGNVYYRFYLIFDKSILNWSTCGSAGLPYLNGIGNRGRDIWTDGDDIYYSYGSDAQYKLRYKYKTCQILEKVAETGDYSDLKNKPVVNPVLEGDEEKLIGLEVENVKYKVPIVKIAGEPETDADVLAKVSETGDYSDLKNKPVIPNEEHLYIYSIEVDNGTDTITLTNIQTSELLQSTLIFDNLINLIQIGSSGVGGDYATLQGSLGFVSQKSNTQFTLLTEDSTSHIFASTDTLTITSHLEKTIF